MQTIPTLIIFLALYILDVLKLFQIGLKMVYEITTIKYCGKSSIFR